MYSLIIYDPLYTWSKQVFYFCLGRIKVPAFRIKMEEVWWKHLDPEAALFFFCFLISWYQINSDSFQTFQSTWGIFLVSDLSENHPVYLIYYRTVEHEELRKCSVTFRTQKNKRLWVPTCTNNLSQHLLILLERFLMKNKYFYLFYLLYKWHMSKLSNEVKQLLEH